MKNEINAVLENMTTTIPEPEDYTGEDGLLYCGKCRKPKEAYFAPDKAAIFGRDRHPAECDCQRTAREEREAAEKRRRHLDTVEELKRRGFTDPTMRDWTFENDNGRNPQAGIARRYVEHWEDMRTDNIGCLFWGGVGTGKSYLAGCIANALMEKEIPVHMTNFALILNDLAASFENRNEYISRLCRYPLLIIDDFGMERGTEYGLEQVFNVIDSRYRSGKPLIVTTNLTLDDLRNPEDTAHSRIYDRLLSMCVPVRFTGDNFRQEAAQRKMESMKVLMGSPQSRKALRGEEEQGSGAKFSASAGNEAEWTLRRRDYRLKGVLPMADNKQHDTRTARRPDCMTKIRMGNSVLVVSGYFKKDTTTTAADKMARVLEAEAAATQKPTYPA